MTDANMSARRPRGPIDMAALAAAITREVEQRGGRRHGAEWRFPCPAPDHDDANPSADWNPEKLAWNCRSRDCHVGRAGARGLAELLGLDVDAFRTTERNNGSGAVAERVHLYRDADGDPVLTVRVSHGADGAKRVRQLVPDGAGSWKSGGGEWPRGRPLFRLPELIAAHEETTIFVVEGERDAETLAAMGLVATTSAMGAGKGRHTSWMPLAGRDVVIVPDHDRPGMAHADDVAQLAHAAGARSIRIVPLPGEAAGEVLPHAHGRDVTDWLQCEHDLDDLLAAAEAAAPWSATEHEGGGGVHTGLPAYPVSALPDPLSSFVREAAAAIGCPPEMVALPLLANAAACLGNRKSLRLKSTWVERPILWTAVVSPPGTAKSPAQDEASRALFRLQAEAKRRYDAEYEAFEQETNAWMAIRPQERGAGPAEPVLEHFLTTDSTIEALAHLAARAPGVVLVRDELAGWVNSFNSYRKGGDRQSFLSSWAGAAIKVDRRSREGCVFVEQPVVCVAGGVQPDMVGALADEAGRRDGFLERILWAMPEVRPNFWTDAEVSPATSESLDRIFRALRYSPTSEEAVTLSPEAKDLWRAWHDDNAVIAAGTPGIMGGVSAKLPRQVARLALVLHCASNPEDMDRPLAAGTMEAAIVLAEFHRQHAAAALALISGTSPSPGAVLAERVFGVLAKAGDAGVPMTGLYRTFNGHVSAAEFDVALAILQGDGRAEKVSVPTGGRPTEMWRIAMRRNEECEQSAAAGGSGRGTGTDSSLSSLRSQDRIPVTPARSGPVRAHVAELPLADQAAGGNEEAPEPWEI